jgi:3D (Asp-Asp-Asp) domain-containing protein
VGDALNDFHFSLGAYDKVTPSLDSQLVDTASVKIVRVNKEQNVQDLPVAFETVTQQDANLPKGKQKTLQEGQQGTKQITTERVYEDGMLVSENVLNEAVTTASVNQIVALGTKNPVVALSASDDNTSSAKAKPMAMTVTKDGVPFTYKKIINNMTLTAYSAEAPSTGKSSGDYGFGITRTGTRVTEGRTIAVDPSVIPLGWWVYIEGIGYRRAEDTGSAVRGNKIDVYYDSEAFAQRFGLKRGFTVYVIGPKNPTQD